jgi:DNA-binding transcriptional MerR regulator
MPFQVRGQLVYRIGEALAEAGLSRSTYFRWIRLGRVPDTQYKDRNGRRVFTQDELQQLKNTAQQLNEMSPQERFSFPGQ